MTETASRVCVACRLELNDGARKCPHCHAHQLGGRMHRGSGRRLIAGVCAAASEHLGIDVLLARVLFLFGLFLSAGIAFWLYVALWLLTPPDAMGVAPLERWISRLRQFFSPRSKAVDRIEPLSHS